MIFDVAKVMHFSVEPTESIVKFSFSGYFRPEMYNSLWLVQTGIIDISESKATEDHNIEETYRRFSYNFVTIVVKPDSFTIGISDYHAFDFLLDFTKSVFTIIKSLLTAKFELFTNFHYKVTDKKVDDVLEIFQSRVNWNPIFDDNLRLDGVIVSSDNELKGIYLNTRVNLAKCGREKMEDNIHIFIRYTIFPKIPPRHKEKVIEPKLQFLGYDKQLLKMRHKTESIVEFLLSSYIL